VVKRRTLGDGLTPEEEAFFNPETPKPKEKPKKTSTKRKEDAPMPRTALKEEAAPRPAFQSTPPAFNPQIALSGVMALNTRISAEISTALLTASMQRKLQRQNPFTQQDIVAEALTDWLRKHGYML
jgi:hypothetical protein